MDRVICEKCKSEIFEELQNKPFHTFYVLTWDSFFHLRQTDKLQVKKHHMVVLIDLLKLRSKNMERFTIDYETI